MRLSGTMPDITPAQVLSVLTFVVAQVVAWGWIDNATGQRLVSVGGILVPAVWQIVDAHIRGNRAKAIAANPALANLTTVQPK